jgi:hypothetical protein
LRIKHDAARAGGALVKCEQVGHGMRWGMGPGVALAARKRTLRANPVEDAPVNGLSGTGFP